MPGRYQPGGVSPAELFERQLGGGWRREPRGWAADARKRAYRVPGSTTAPKFSPAPQGAATIPNVPTQAPSDEPEHHGRDDGSQDGGGGGGLAWPSGYRGSGGGGNQPGTGDSGPNPYGGGGRTPTGDSGTGPSIGVKVSSPTATTPTTPTDTSGGGGPIDTSGMYPTDAGYSPDAGAAPDLGAGGSGAAPLKAAAVHVPSRSSGGIFLLIAAVVVALYFAGDL